MTMNMQSVCALKLWTKWCGLGQRREKRMADRLDVNGWREKVKNDIVEDKQTLYGILLSILDTLVDIKYALERIER
jgi:hypothetical protein